MIPSYLQPSGRTRPLALVLALAFALLLAACGPGGTPEVEVDATPTPDTGVGTQPTQPTMDGAATPAAGGPSTLDDIRERGRLRVGVKYDAPPFGSQNVTTNEVTGFDVDIARGLAQEILGDPNAVELVRVTSQNRIPMLESGQIDMFAATATITPERLETIDFSDVYYRAGQSLLVPTDSDIQTYEDLSGRNVCSVTGSTPEQTIRRLVPDAEVTLFETYPECFTALRSGRVDAITTDNVILRGLQQQAPDEFKLTGGLFTFEPYGLGIGKGNDELKQAVNEGLRALEESGRYADIHQQWLDEPLPEDFNEWFLMPAEEAAQLFENQTPGQPVIGGTPGPEGTPGP